MSLNVDQIDKRYNIRPFKETPLSAANVQQIELDALDLSLFQYGSQNHKDRIELAKKLERSLSTYGFIAIVNYGIERETLSHLSSIAQSICELPEEIQKGHLAGALKSDLENINQNSGAEGTTGFKPKGYWLMGNNVYDNIVHYHFTDMLHPQFFDPERNYPELVRAHLSEVSNYFKHLHHVVLKKLSILSDIILELPEGYLWENYFKVDSDDLQNSGQGGGRFMLYSGMSSEEEIKTNNQWLRGHSDITGFTFITSQPMLSLQIRDYYTGVWKYVGHVPGGLIVNIGDAMEFITGGYFKSTVHRVVPPPDDQKEFRRLVLIYFSGPKNTSVLDPQPLNSPKLNRLGFKKPSQWEEICFKDWNDKKASLFGKTIMNDSNAEEPNLVMMYGRLHEKWHQAESSIDVKEVGKNFKIVELKS